MRRRVFDEKQGFAAMLRAQSAWPTASKCRLAEFISLTLVVCVGKVHSPLNLDINIAVGMW